MKYLSATMLALALMGLILLSCTSQEGIESTIGSDNSDQSGPLVFTDEQSQDPGDPTDIVTVTTNGRSGVETFPNTQWSYWVYDVLDTVSGLTTEYIVTISDTTTLFGNVHVSVWQYAIGEEVVYTEYVNVTADTVSFYRTVEGTTYRYRKLVFPIEVGNTWDFMVQRGAEYYDIASFQIIPAAGGYFDAYEVEANHRSGMLDAVDNTVLWFAPGLGFPRIDHTLGWRQTINSHEIWSLTWYFIAAP